jgi:hypothetical protein
MFTSPPVRVFVELRHSGAARIRVKRNQHRHFTCQIHAFSSDDGKERMMKTFTLFLLLATIGILSAMTQDDWRFCRDHELWSVVTNHRAELDDRLARAETAGDTLDADFFYHMLDQYCLVVQDTLGQARLFARRALNRGDFDAACALLQSAAANPALKDALGPVLEQVRAHYTREDQQAVITLLEKDMPELVRSRISRELLMKYGEINSQLSGWAKEWVDEIAVETNDSLRTAAVDKFLQIPRSVWTESLLSWRWNGLIAAKKLDVAADEMRRANPTPVQRYLMLRTIMDPTFYRKAPFTGATGPDSTAWIRFSADVLDKLETGARASGQTTFRVFYDNWTKSYLLNKTAILRARIALAGIPLRASELDSAYAELLTAKYDNNDAGEVAELHYWRGKLLQAIPGRELDAANAYLDCLIAGAPRKRYDIAAYTELSRLHDRLAMKSPVMVWARSLKNYQGPAFDDETASAGLKDCHEGRVAWGDYDNDGRFDLLLNGNRLFHNLGNGRFVERSDTAGVSGFPSNGGLWADFDRDGRLDFMSISHDPRGNGEKIMRQVAPGRFAPVNDKAGNIDDRSPTEGAAWIDRLGDGFPELYCACYETAGTFNGNPDFFWENDKGLFRDVSEDSGIRTEFNNEKNPQCGRGVAPADYDNDGDQEILVTNYRLDRNFLYDPGKDGKYRDIAAREGIQGFEAQGCYGHSIGADWGDFDNDGDLDLFVANLAHPRYIAFSNKSILYRNDGLETRDLGGDNIPYNRFTDITAQSGILYDELHSDPTWFDVDNDGDLDLFITSIYENDRSYLYLNDGVGHFTDVTFLAGCRTYNGWGNAVADYDGDGLVDLCIASGSGMKLFHNRTPKPGKSIAFRPWRDAKGVHATNPANWRTNIPNTPPWGARIVLTTKDKLGVTRTRIRELCSAKGTTSQNAQALWFGYGDEELVRASLEYRGKSTKIDPAELGLK